MKKITLTNNLFALVDDEDFEAISKHKWDATRGRNTWYAMAKIDGKLKRMHKLLIPGMEWVDHKDGNGLNNQRNNLRQCTPVQNGGNSIKKRRNKSGFKGVSWSKSHGRWEACICIDYKTKHLGKFKNIQDAADAYDRAAEARFGEFAMTNKRMRLEQKL
jgi:hypothetical protein